MINVSVIGATGYVGAELLRLLDKLICSYTHETDKLL